jgi:two-component system uhpT operon response regulator UhpA
MVLKIGLIDDHEMVRQSFAHLLSQERQWEVTEQYSSYQDVESRLRESRCDVFLLDISLPDKNGLDVLKLISQRKLPVRVIMLSMYEHFHYVSKAIDLGASGYVSKRAAAEELVKAIQKVIAGENYLSPEVAANFVFNGKNSLDTLSLLTQREQEIFALLALGNSPKKIAQITETMPKTVLSHRANIYNKTNTRSQFELLQLGFRHGVFDLSDVL